VGSWRLPVWASPGTQAVRHVFGQIRINVEQMRDDTRADRQCFHLAQFKDERVGHVAARFVWLM
jgi:hypothetical protein